MANQHFSVSVRKSNDTTFKCTSVFNIVFAQQNAKILVCHYVVRCIAYV